MPYFGPYRNHAFHLQSRRGKCKIINPIQNYDDSQQKRLQQDILEYVNDQKMMLQKLLEFKDTLKAIMPLKLQERTYYTNFSKFLSIYEQ